MPNQYHGLLLYWFEAAQLAAWGIGMLLLFLTIQRIANMVHVALARRCSWVPAPRTVYEEVRHPTDLLACIAALALGTTVSLAYGRGAYGDGPLRYFFESSWDLPFNIMRVHCALLLEGFFIWKIARNPKYKLGWMAAWCIFSAGVVAWQYAIA